MCNICSHFSTCAKCKCELLCLSKIVAAAHGVRDHFPDGDNKVYSIVPYIKKIYISFKWPNHRRPPKQTPPCHYFFFGNSQNLHSDIHRYWHRHRSSDAHKDTVQIELLFSTHCGMTYLFLISEQLLVAKNDVALSINGNLRKSLLLRKIRGKNTQNRVESLWFSLCAKQASYF